MTSSISEGTTNRNGECQDPRPSESHHQTIIQIYLDWANHYLQKGRSTRRIQDLQEDLRDGVLIADIIHAITNQRVPGVTRKPKNGAQMLENLESVLVFVTGLGVSVDGVSAKELRDGQLRPILRLFFELSRLKTQKEHNTMNQVVGHQPIHHHHHHQFPKKDKTGKGSSGIPVPGNQASTPIKKPSTTTIPSGVSLGGLHPPVPGTISGNSSRSTSPSSVPIPSQQSFIPVTPKSVSTQLPTRMIPEKDGITNVTNKAPTSANSHQEKSSMLQKLRLFRDRNGSGVNAGGGTPTSTTPVNSASKRTSSSSGFSSAKSDSSISNDTQRDHLAELSRDIPDDSKISSKRPEKRSSESLPTTTNGNPPSTSFLRNPRTLSASNKDSRLRYSVTGIPTRPNANNGLNNNPPSTTGGGSVGGSQVTTQIPQPKPTAAIKGHTKPSSSTNPALHFNQQQPIKKRVRPESSSVPSQVTTEIQITTGKKAIVAPLQPTTNQRTDGKLVNPDIGKLNTSVDGKLIDSIGDGEEEDEILKDVRPMEPFQRKSTYAPLRSPPFQSPPGGMTNPSIIVDLQAELSARDGAEGKRLLSNQIQKEISLDESSSLSSGISDINEVSTDPGNSVILASPYASLQRLGKDNNSQQRFSSKNSNGGGNCIDTFGLIPWIKGDDEDSHIEKSIMTGLREEFVDGKSSGEDWSRRSKLCFGYTRAPTTSTPPMNGMSMSKVAIPSNPSQSPSTQQHHHSSSRYGSMEEPRVANHVSLSQRPPPHLLLPSSKSRPRTRVKVSGGTQTTSDLNSIVPDFQIAKTYSLNTPNSTQLSENLRQRILIGSQSLPKGASADYTALLSSIQQQHFQHHRLQQLQQQEEARRARERRLIRESPYAIYAELKETYAQQSLHRHSSPYSQSSVHSPGPCRINPGCGGSLTEAESMESLNSSSSAAAHARESRNRSRGSTQMPPREPSPSGGLNRSNSISHFCERTFPRSTKSEKIYPSMLARTEEPILFASPRGQPGEPSSLLSTPSRMGSAYSTGNTNKNQPLRLSMSPYAAFARPNKDDDLNGSSLSLVSTASSIYSTTEEKQAHELRKLKRELQENQEKIHTLNNQLSTNAHVVAAFEQSLANMTHRLQSLTLSAEQKDSELTELRQTIELLRKQSIEAGLIIPRLSPGSRDGSGIGRQLSADSVSSINSISSATSSQSHASVPIQPLINNRAWGKGWLRSSFSKAFSRSKSGKSKEEDPPKDTGNSETPPQSSSSSPQRGEPSSSSSTSGEEKEKSVEELRKQLREKEMVLTDIRLEALTSAHQLESLKETMSRMRNEMLNLRQENERLQRILTVKSMDYAATTERANSEPSIDVDLVAPGEKEGKRIVVSVALGQFDTTSDTLIGILCVSTRTKWDLLDSLVRRNFKEYLGRLDPAGNLGLSPDSILSYTVGEALRSRDGSPPELLPCGYLVGDVNRIRIQLRGPLDGGAVDSLAFQTLINKQTLLRWITCLSESRRILLSGVRGVGKSYLAHRLAEWLVEREGKEPSPEAIITFSGDGRGTTEIEEYLSGLWTEEWESGDFASVLIIENLQVAIHESFTIAKHAKPFLIATTTRSPSDTNLLHTFRCIDLNPCMDPIKGLVGRFLERRVIEIECGGTDGSGGELIGIIHWIPQVLAKFNEELERGGVPPIGPRVFLSCPTDVDGAETWFTNLWNKTLRPHLHDVLGQTESLGIGVDDTFHFILRTFPWTSTDKILK